MPIKDIPNIKFITPTHRCYEYILDFIVATTSFGSYFKVYHNQPVTSFAPTQSSLGLGYPSIHFCGNASKRNVAFVPHELFADIILNNTRNSQIAYLEESLFPDISGVTTDAAIMIEGFTSTMFVRFYEDNKPLIKVKYSEDSNNWPEIFRFAKVIRDCMSHSGKIRIDNAKSRPVTHFGLTYSSADNGKKVLHDHLTSADIFYLMLDMDLVF